MGEKVLDFKILVNHWENQRHTWTKSDAIFDEKITKLIRDQGFN